MIENKERSQLLDDLLECMDFIGWVPCINQELSLKFFNTANSSRFDYINNCQSILLGDIDKYSISIKTTQKNDEFKTKYYITATSFYTCRDSKIGKEFNRTFRFIFIGAINDEIYQNSFIERTKTETIFLKDLKKEENLLLGKLIILPYLEKVRNEENEFLKAIQKLEKLNDIYNEKYSKISSSFEELSEAKKNALNQYKIVESCFKRIEEIEDEEYIEKEEKEKLHKPTILDVALYRDGVLFLKDNIQYLIDDKEDKYVKDHFEVNKLEDFRKHIAVHRIYKEAYHFIKFLFHKNYYHDEKDDTMLPISNLHPHHKNNEDTQKDTLYKIIKHQLNSFFSEIFIEKRTNESKRESVGVLLYAKAFVSAFANKGMIKHDDAEILNKRINLSIKDIETFSNSRKYNFTSFIQSKSRVTAIILGLTFVMAFSPLIIELNEKTSIFKFLAFENPTYNTTIGLIIPIAIFFIIGYSIQRIEHLFSKNKIYRPQKQKSNILFVNTNTKKGKLDWRYSCQILHLFDKLSTNSKYVRMPIIIGIISILIVLGIISIIIIF
ncbi:MAG: hypothetical protein LBM05_01740 [Endomicrobium sp.]|jgi:hypothetical protein|nr:hypothetical protein [Endomicrobium sp.]